MLLLIIITIIIPNANSDEEQGGRNTDDAYGYSPGGTHIPQIIIDCNELLC